MNSLECTNRTEFLAILPAHRLLLFRLEAVDAFDEFMRSCMIRNAFIAPIASYQTNRMVESTDTMNQLIEFPVYIEKKNELITLFLNKEEMERATKGKIMCLRR